MHVAVDYPKTRTVLSVLVYGKYSKVVFFKAHHKVRHRSEYAIVRSNETANTENRTPHKINGPGEIASGVRIGGSSESLSSHAWRKF